MFTKNKIILFGAIAIAILLTFPRALINLADLNEQLDYGLSFQGFIIQSVFLFGLILLILNFNLKWKERWFSFQIVNPYLKDIILNFGFLFIIIALLTLFKSLFTSNDISHKWFFLLNFFVNIEALSLILLFSWLVNLFEESQQNLLEKELAHQLAALRNQVNPHFLFNSLNSLHTLVLKKSANTLPFVENLSKLLSQTLQRSKEEYIYYLEAYLFLQKERFGDKLKVDISIPQKIKKVILPSFSLQLLVENAIKHNVVSTKLPLLIKIYMQDDFLVVSNPIQKRRDAIESTGLGLSNLSQRFKLLKKEDIQIEKKENLFKVKLRIL